MLVVPVDAVDPDPRVVERAGEVLRAGGLVAFPTETVYGLGAHACDPGAVARIFTAKGRPADNPLIVHVAAIDGLAAVAAHVPPLAEQLAARWWPGPLTLVVEAAPSIPSVTTGGLRSVAVRMPRHPVALALMRAAGVPIAAPSANRSGRPSPTTAAHVVDDFGDVVDLVIDAGACEVGVESTVVDVRGEVPVVLREGSVTREQLGVAAAAVGGDVSASPGTRYRHYAPACEVAIAPAGRGGEVAQAHAAAGRRVGLVGTAPTPPPVRVLAEFRDAQQLARVLYHALRAADDCGMDVVVVEAVAEEGIGRAVMDRVRRAAAG